MVETDFLFARPSFIEGMARIFDFAGTLNVYNDSKDEQHADFKAISNDFKMVGQDIQKALNQSVQKKEKV